MVSGRHMVNDARYDDLMFLMGFVLCAADTGPFARMPEPRGAGAHLDRSPAIRRRSAALGDPERANRRVAGLRSARNVRT
jgi:hypothetical protein